MLKKHTCTLASDPRPSLSTHYTQNKTGKKKKKKKKRKKERGVYFFSFLLSPNIACIVLNYCMELVKPEIRGYMYMYTNDIAHTVTLCTKHLDMTNTCGLIVLRGARDYGTQLLTRDYGT